MEEYIKELKKQIFESLSKKQSDWEDKVFNSQQYQQELKYINDVTYDFVNTLRSIFIYSTRAGNLYDDFLCIRAIDDLIQSSIGIHMLINNGIHNTVKRELRYLIEMITKYVIVDYAKMRDSFEIKTRYLKENIPNSSIEIVTEYSTPFSTPIKENFQNEIKDFFYKACAYVHPSKKQIDEQINNYRKGHSIGFESAKMLSNITKTVFRAYDMILVMVFHSFGISMSKDLFEQIFNDNEKWKFHKGKYIIEFSKVL
jgi:hypothetical protein